MNKYRMKVVYEPEGCYGRDCNVYYMQKPVTFLGIHLWWKTINTYYGENKDEGYKLLRQYNDDSNL